GVGSAHRNHIRTATKAIDDPTAGAAQRCAAKRGAARPATPPTDISPASEHRSRRRTPPDTRHPPGRPKNT
ncbi:MAG: hypothetical protein JXA67_05965, partial [Micromonosporaceae bacterium]|nr:hypothetical protein [Micromonosporaceae bacterium]